MYSSQDPVYIYIHHDSGLRGLHRPILDQRLTLSMGMWKPPLPEGEAVLRKDPSFQGGRRRAVDDSKSIYITSYQS